MRVKMRQNNQNLTQKRATDGRQNAKNGNKNGGKCAGGLAQVGWNCTALDVTTSPPTCAKPLTDHKKKEEKTL
ncbi:MAG: hypothetical protein LBH82_07340 [Bacteroidales bacterium]|nr:hypothetical protein [Bacteroidales bacterium]